MLEFLRDLLAAFLSWFQITRDLFYLEPRPLITAGRFH